MNKYTAPSLLLMIVLVAFPQISETIYTPSLPDIAVALGASNSSVQLTLSIYFIGFALGVFCWGWLSDFIGRRPAMLGGLIVYGIGSLMCFYAESITFLLVSRFIQAFGAATGSVITQTILRESLSGSKRHAMFAQISAVIAFTPAIGPLIGGWVDQALGFKAVFCVLIIMSILLFIYAYCKLPETTNVSTRKRIAIYPVVKRIISSPQVVVFGLVIGGINGILFSYYAEAPFIFIEHFHISPGLYGFLGIVVALASIFGAMISKKLVSIWQPEKNYSPWLLRNDYWLFITNTRHYSCYSTKYRVNDKYINVYIYPVIGSWHCVTELFKSGARKFPRCSGNSWSYFQFRLLLVSKSRHIRYEFSS